MLSGNGDRGESHLGWGSRTYDAWREATFDTSQKWQLDFGPKFVIEILYYNWNVQYIRS